MSNIAAISLFESYNSAVENIFDDYIRSGNNEDVIKIKEDTMKSLVKNNIGKWNATSIGELSGKSPIEVVNEINDIDTALEFFKAGARICDKDLPDIFIERLKSFPEINENLLLIVKDRTLFKNDDDSYIPVMAVKLLGEWKANEAVEVFLEQLDKMDEDMELLVEELTTALINIGKPAIDKIINLLEESNDINYGREYILTALVKIGIDNKSDAIYRCIRNVFLKMEDKLLGAMCFGDYGDGRAVAFLRGYVEKNKSTLNKETLNEILAAIKKLGGEIKDL